MWRVVDADRSPTDASRSARYAGRWHHPAESLAVYTASTRAAAIEEARDLRLPGVYPVTVAHLAISDRRVISLPDVADRLRWPLAHLLEDGRGYFRAILVGTMACRAGVDVLMVPSARDPGADCAVCFMRHRPTIEVMSTAPDTLTIS